ncbi:hypothetical protein NUW58_g8892 [Xylaria curta]|uniref:Uncharacterized protein n=1 Tax=Xylaria curta TaxID=42375 RepID=A0ACC1N3Q4_9PEZI|nr:hypothetical protein NUW58_g8892 [Xylaria curta]
MAANRGLPVAEATESLSASGDSAPLRMSVVDVLGSPGPSPVDPLANRPDPSNPADLPGHGPSRLGPTSPLQPTQADGDDGLMTPSDHGRGDAVLQKKEHDDEVVADDDDDAASPSRLNKGKAPETTYVLSTSEQSPETRSYEETLDSLRQARDPTATMESEYYGDSVDLIETATNEEDSESSSQSTQSDSRDASYPSSLFEEAQDQDSAATTSGSADQSMSWKQKQKQKANPVSETESLSEALDGEKPFQPLSLGDPGWEKSAGRPPQKLPVRFRDAVGRNFLFPWEKAKTWLVSNKPLLCSFGGLTLQDGHGMLFLMVYLHNNRE